VLDFENKHLSDLVKDYPIDRVSVPVSLPYGVAGDTGFD
jgi:hypothetical protein